MKTRTLLLLSVATGLLILLAGGVLLFQLSNQQEASDSAGVGESVTVGDLSIVVVDVVEGGGRFDVAVEMGGVDDSLDSIRLVTGDRRLEAIDAPAEGRCTEITVAEQRCLLEFDVSLSESSNRTLVVRRGDEQVIWNLSGS